LVKRADNNKEIQRIIRDHLENLYSNKLENLEEIHKFIDKYDHPKLNQQDINHLHRSITSNEIKVAIKSLPKRKVQNLTDALLNFTTSLRKK
jgi:hypothetical protein